MRSHDALQMLLNRQNCQDKISNINRQWEHLIPFEVQNLKLPNVLSDSLLSLCLIFVFETLLLL